MKIIDAHLHFCPGQPYFDAIVKASGHENTASHLRESFERHGIVGGVVMSNQAGEENDYHYPDFLRYCIGLDSAVMSQGTMETWIDLAETHLKRKDCVGIKLYPGYQHFYVSEKRFYPFYELAQYYHKPVAIHMGATASSAALLQYSHPLTLDPLAVAFPHVQFVMCHFGNPFLSEAAAVVSKNQNVAADLSGILEGKLDMPVFLQENQGYVGLLKTWIRYVGDYSRFLYGTDWPLVHIGDYIDFIAYLIPEAHWNQVFFENANEIYHLGFS